jgi:hypothetical protein
MQELIRKNTIPKEFNREKLKELFPTATIVGDVYGFFYHVEATNTVFVSYGWRDLTKTVQEHLVGNGIEIPVNLALIMQATFCQYRPDLCVERSAEAEERVGAFLMMKRFYNSAVKPYLAGQLVDQEEANRRAAICATCPKNTDKLVEFCVSCSTRSLVGHINQFLTSRHTPSDPLLKTCQICSCDLKMKCWCPKSSMDEPELRDKWPTDHPCWMK